MATLTYVLFTLGSKLEHLHLGIGRNLAAIMQLNREHFEQIRDLLPRHHGNVRLDSLQVLNAILYLAANGCKWRALPEHYGP